MHASFAFFHRRREGLNYTGNDFATGVVLRNGFHLDYLKLCDVCRLTVNANKGNNRCVTKRLLI